MVHTISTLCVYSFAVKQSDEDKYNIHKLIHLTTRIWIDRHGYMADVTEKAVWYVAEVFPSDNYANRAVWRAYLPHAL